MVSRPTGRTFSELVSGTGDHQIRSAPVGRCACRMAALRSSPVPASWVGPGRPARIAPGGVSPARPPHPANSKYRLPGDFQPARWTVVPAPAGTMCRHAGKIRLRRLPDVPVLRILSTIRRFRIVSGPDERGWLTEPPAPWKATGTVVSHSWAYIAGLLVLPVSTHPPEAGPSRPMAGWIHGATSASGASKTTRVGNSHPVPRFSSSTPTGRGHRVARTPGCSDGRNGRDQRGRFRSRWRGWE
jgi:hypothetical protein